jgi:Protein of unknown function (DUF3987)
MHPVIKSVVTTDDRWPKPLGKAAYHGVLGEIVTTIAPQTEADPVAILVQLLVMFGNCIGKTPRFPVGPDVHHLNLFAAIVGTTAKSRKGMSRNHSQQLFAQVDEDWGKRIAPGGISSGEGLIYAVCDPITKPHPIREKGRVIGYEDIIEEKGEQDKRLLVIETELASTFEVMKRDGNTLSPVMRTAWDGSDLRTLTKKSALRATAPHISFIGHITSDELRRKLDATEAANGFGNRFLWVLVKRSNVLPMAAHRWWSRRLRADSERRWTPPGAHHCCVGTAPRINSGSTCTNRSPRAVRACWAR